MIKLFDDKDNYTAEANKLDREFKKLIESFIEKCQKDGISIRDLTVVLINSLNFELVKNLVKRKRN